MHLCVLCLCGGWVCVCVGVCECIDIVRAYSHPVTQMVAMVIQVTELDWLSERLKVMKLLQSKTQTVLPLEQPDGMTSTHTHTHTCAHTHTHTHTHTHCTGQHHTSL